MLRQPLLYLSRQDWVKNAVVAMPVSSGIVSRFVPGEATASAVAASRVLLDSGLLVTLDFLGEDTLDRSQADATVSAYLDVLAALGDMTRNGRTEVSVKPSAVGLALPGEGPEVALEHARTIAQAARDAGTTVTLDMEDHTTTDATLEILRQLREDFPETGAVLQAYLRRTEADCRELSGPGSRVRLCKGAYAQPEEVAYQSKLEVDRSYVRCLSVLMAGEGYPMVATHDPTMVSIAGALAARSGRAPDSYEYQMLFGTRPDEQRRLAEAGNQVRVYIPYGDEWYGYLMRRLAERPANLTFFLRSLMSKK